MTDGANRCGVMRVLVITLSEIKNVVNASLRPLLILQEHSPLQRQLVASLSNTDEDFVHTLVRVCGVVTRVTLHLRLQTDMLGQQRAHLFC